MANTRQKYKFAAILTINLLNFDRTTTLATPKVIISVKRRHFSKKCIAVTRMDNMFRTQIHLIHSPTDSQCIREIRWKITSRIHWKTLKVPPKTWQLFKLLNVLFFLSFGTVVRWKARVLKRRRLLLHNFVK